jgi:hypothetical protein
MTRHLNYAKSDSPSYSLPANRRVLERSDVRRIEKEMRAANGCEQPDKLINLVAFPRTELSTCYRSVELSANLSGE